MIKNIIYFLFFCCSISTYSQHNFFDIVPPRLNVFIDEKGDTKEMVTRTSPSLEYLCPKSYNNNKLLITYIASVFRFSNKSSKPICYSKQWNTPIVIYFDKIIPKEVIKVFKKFYEPLSQIKNLSLSYTTNIEESNYYIKITNDNVNGYTDSYSFKSEQEKKIFSFTNFKYFLSIDKNKKIYSCILKVNKDELNNNTLLLKKLKQNFFLSLGAFTVNYSFSSIEDLLHKNYDNNPLISINDIDLLKMHYGEIYEQKINSNTFNKLRMISKNNCIHE